jgi:hypothetical protein
MKNAMPSALYVIAGSGAVKVGRSRCPEGRRKVLSAASGATLRIVMQTEARDDASFIEAEAHRLLERKRIVGEWFDVSEAEAVAVLERSIADVGGASVRVSERTLTIAPSLKADLQALAEREHRSLTNYIEVVLLQHIQREKGEARP